MPKLSVTDCAYAAGIIDGEGCVTAVTNHRKNGNSSLYVLVTVTNCDPGMASWLKAKFGGYVFSYQPKLKNSRRVWKWNLKSNMAFQMLSKILPYSVIKRDQVTIAIRLQSLISKSSRRYEKGRIGPRPLDPAVVSERMILREQLKQCKHVRH